MVRLCCLDLDTFFVSVERLLDPTLNGKPVVVGATGWRGVVTSASYEVRALGVHSGMPISEARKLAPNAVYLATRHDTYGAYATQVRELLERGTDQVQTASIDEFFLDFRGCERLWRTEADVDDDAAIERRVREIRQAIHDEIGLPASAGLARSRPLAKMASKVAKPAGVFRVAAGTERAFVETLSVRAFPGIGPVGESAMQAAGIKTLGQLLDLPEALRPRFGRWSTTVREAIEGTSRPLGRNRPAFQEHDPHGTDIGSISNERTFMADIGAAERVRDQVFSLVERVCWRARKRGVMARTVTLKLRTTDFHTVTRSATGNPTDNEAELRSRIGPLVDAAWSGQLPVRLVGVALSNLGQKPAQLDLPLQGGPRPKVGEAIDEVRERFGYDAIRLGVTLGSRR